jgi:hypothetical protein
MKEEDLNQKDNSQKLSDSSEDQLKEVEKKGSILNKLIFVICCSIVGFVGLNFVACNFMIPGTISRANVLGGLKNPPPLDCKESERRGYDVLVTILTTVIALKTRMED